MFDVMPLKDLARLNQYAQQRKDMLFVFNRLKIWLRRHHLSIMHSFSDRKRSCYASSFYENQMKEPLIRI